MKNFFITLDLLAGLAFFFCGVFTLVQTDGIDLVMVAISFCQVLFGQALIIRGIGGLAELEEAR